MKNHKSNSIPIAAVIAAGGSGTRMSSAVPKQFLELAGKPILLHTVERVLELDGIFQIVIALPSRHIARARAMLAGRQWRVPVQCVRGGATRQESVRRGVARIPRKARLILVHDAVRPLCGRETMERVLEAALKYGGAVPGMPATETMQRVSRQGRVLSSPPREELYAIQTPQCFQADVLTSALERAEREGFAGTDESSVVRWAGHRVTVVPGSPTNIKITQPLDLEVAELLLRAGRRSSGRSDAVKNKMMRIGQGIDYHRLVEGRKLFIGGLEIPFEKGLEGHSDADVLSHAICDALLGAAGLGDMGVHFPSEDPRHRNRSSLEFLREVRDKVEKAGWSIRNVDATLLAERPKLAPFREQIRRNVAEALRLDPDDVSVKATTTEGMNAEGRGEGISAQAVALLEKK